MGVCAQDQIALQRRPASAVLVGRETELAVLRDAVSNPPALVTLVGEAGIGKSRLGAIVTANLADYHVASNADVGDLEAAWIDELDPHVNPMGTKGIGEIGIVGSAAAIANAVFHATGLRVRDLPITPDKLLGAG